MSTVQDIAAPSAAAASGVDADYAQQGAQGPMDPLTDPLESAQDDAVQLSGSPPSASAEAPSAPAPMGRARG